MIMENKTHWNNKFFTGVGTRFDFEKKYNEINDTKDTFIAASTKYPRPYAGSDANANMVYEYDIFYKTAPSQTANVEIIDAPTAQVPTAAVKMIIA